MSIQEGNLPALRDDAITLTFTTSVQEAQGRLQELQSFVKSVMKKDEDFGIIPGTPKPTLLKPGAEKLCEIYGLAPQLEITNRVEDWTNGFFHYEVKCSLVHKRHSVVVAEGVGSCNTKEARYRWRWVSESKIPAGVDVFHLLKKSGNKWVFKSEIPQGTDISKLPTEVRTSKKTGSPYTVYNTGQTIYRVENDDPYTLVNTVLKMAKKRALVDAALSATRSSGIFTQDMEDITDWEEPIVEQPKPQAQPRENQPQTEQEIIDVTPEASNAEVKHECVECGKSITQAVYAYSEKNHGKPLCQPCQKKGVRASA